MLVEIRMMRRLLAVLDIELAEVDVHILYTMYGVVAGVSELPK